MVKSKLIIFLIILLIVSNGILLFLLYRKLPTAPPVIVAFEGKSAAYSKKFNGANDDFWNNYPYIIITNEGKLIDTAAYFDRRTYSRLDKLRSKQIFRYIQNNDHSVVNDSTLSSLQAFPDVAIVTDSISIKHLQRKLELLKLDNNVYVLVRRRINSRSDRIGQSYLFSITRDGKMSNLYYPRPQTAGLTKKYLDYVTKSVTFH